MNSTAFSQEIETSIDISYTYTRENNEGVITLSEDIGQSYELTYSTSLGYFYNFTAKLAVGYDIEKGDDQATSKSLSPSLDLELEGGAIDLIGSYKAERDDTESFGDDPSMTSYSNEYVIESRFTTDYFPEVLLKMKRARDYEEQNIERVKKELELNLIYELGDLNFEFDYTRTKDEDILPETIDMETQKWTATVDYGSTFFDFLDLELEYNAEEEFIEEYGKRGVFVSSEKSYIQQFSSRLGADFTIPRNFDLGLDYSFDFEQDLIKEEFDYETTHKFSADLSRDFLRWIKANLKYEGMDERTYAVEGEDDEETVKSTFAGSIQAKPFSWIDLSSKAEKEYQWEVEENTGYTVVKEETNAFETKISTNYRKFIELSGTHSYEEIFNDDLLEEKTTEYAFEANIDLYKTIAITPSFDISLSEEYNTEPPLYSRTSTIREWEAELALSFEKDWLELISLVAEYNISYSFNQELDEYLNLSEERNFSEDFKFQLMVNDLIRGMTIELEYTLKSDDAESDDEPMITDQTYAAKLDWDIKDFRIKSEYKYDNKEDADDSSSFNFGITWAKHFYEIVGEYEFKKTYSLELEESEVYDFQFKMNF